MIRSVQIGDVIIGSPMHVDDAGCEWILSMPGISGWDNSGAGVRRDEPEHPGAHGSFALHGWRTGRSIGLSGTVICPSRAAAAIVVQRLNSLLADGTLAEVTVVDQDLPRMSAHVGLADMPDIDWSGPWGRTVRFGLELWAPDPLRYGDPVAASTSFPTLRGGLRFPLYTDGAGTDLGWLDYGEPSDTGRVTLHNPGTADVPVLLQVTGPVPEQGFDVIQVGTGGRLTFEGPVGAGSLLVLDGATGAVAIDGSQDRAGRLTRRDWPTVPRRGSVELLFSPRGPWSEAQMMAVVRPGWW